MATAPNYWQRNQDTPSIDKRGVQPERRIQWESLLNSTLYQTPQIQMQPPAEAQRRNVVSFKNVLQAIEDKQRRLRRAARTKLEMQWLNEHRDEFVGRWVALVGDRLLAVGNSAREVFNAARVEPEVPLVVQVEGPNAPPFGGW